jgi:transcriptional antiterminator RfaH
MYIEKPSWYCARTKPKHEHLAAVGLVRQRGLEVFNPRLRMERATQRGLVRVIEPLFPGYIFVRCPSSESLEEVRYSVGISSLVHFGQRIAVVPDDVVEDLKMCFDTGELMSVEDHLEAGTEVILGSGPFEGFRATVVRSLPARRRVQVLLDFLGRTTLTEVDRNCVVPEDRGLGRLMPLLAVQANAA